MIEDTLLEIKYFFKKTIRGIKNIIYWFDVIWNDIDGDLYTEKILLHKLKREYASSVEFNKKFIKPVGKDKILKSMRICINILEDKEKGYYNDKHMKIMFLIMSKYFNYWWD